MTNESVTRGEARTDEIAQLKRRVARLQRLLTRERQRALQEAARAERAETSARVALRVAWR